jgi:hypothetical protein
MIPPNDVWMREFMQARYEEYLKEAEAHRLLKFSLQDKPKREPFYTRALFRIGKVLVGWGERLVRRYDPAPRAMLRMRH